MSEQTARGSQPHKGVPGQLPPLPQYEVLRYLSSGGMGDLYLARHVHLDRTVVVKWLRSHESVSPQAGERFAREMKAVGQVVHPNVVHATDGGIASGRRYLVMEYIDGIDLNALCRCVGRLPIADACEIIRQAALGLGRAHQHGIVHRDIKPTNIMLAADGCVKVLDLGLALLQQDPADHTLTSADSGPFGTWDYMSPEQWDNTHNVDHRTDLYSLGCTFYYLLCGHAPFGTDRHSSPVSKMRAHVLEDVPPIQDLRPDVPDGLRDLVDRLLRKQPEQRLESADRLARNLAPFATGCDLRNLISSAHVGNPALVNEQTTNPESQTIVAGESDRGPGRPLPSDGPATKISQSATAVAVSNAAPSTRLARWLFAGTVAAALFTAGAAAAILFLLNSGDRSVAGRFADLPAADTSGPVGDSHQTPVPTLVPDFEPVPQQRLRENDPVTVFVGIRNIRELEGKLAFEAPGAPDGLSIDDTGVIHWQPGERDGGTGEPIVVTVRAQSLDPNVQSAETTVTFDVAEINQPPRLKRLDGMHVAAASGRWSAAEGEPFEVAIVLDDDDIPPNALQLSAIHPLPDGAELIRVDGAERTWKLAWTPGEQYGGEDDVQIRLQAGDGIDRTELDPIRIVVAEVNRKPTIACVNGLEFDEQMPWHVEVAEGDPLQLTVDVADPDLPANSLTLAAVGDLPSGAQLEPVAGKPRTWRLTWVPDEASGGGDPVAIRLRARDDDDSSDMRSVIVTVGEVNTPPVIADIAPQSVGPGEEFILDIDITDADLPPQELSVKLVQPEGLDVRRMWLPDDEGSPDTLRFLWRPDFARDIGRRREFTLRVTDNGTPPLEATRAFEVNVGRYLTNSIGMRLAMIPAGEFRMGDLNPEQLEQLIPKAPEIPEPPERQRGLRPLFGSGSPPGQPMAPITPVEAIESTPSGAEGDEEATEEKPLSEKATVRQLVVASPFYIGAHEVTQAQYESVMGDNPSYFSAAGPGRDTVADLDPGTFPVESVSHAKALEFCRRLSERPEERMRGRVYRLPAEIEWEYACRAGTETMYHTGRWLSSMQANFDGRYPPRGTRPGPYLRRSTTVGSYEPNHFGLYDMHGNVAEWCADWYAVDAYQQDLEWFGPPEGEERVVRGGSYHSQRPHHTRSAARDSRDPADGSPRIGFRVVCEIAAPQITDPDGPVPDQSED